MEFLKMKKDKMNLRKDHYYSKNPSSEDIRKEINLILNLRSLNNFKNIEFDKIFELKFLTSSGVFSKSKPDLGSTVFIRNANPKGKTLDMGCGYGLIGIALKKIYPEIEMTCSDINSRAVLLTVENAKKNFVELKVIQSDIFNNITENFDTILINLPQNAGKNVCFKMISDSRLHLNDFGTLQVVSRHKKGGEQYELKMREVFGNCQYLGKESGYRVYSSYK